MCCSRLLIAILFAFFATVATATGPFTSLGDLFQGQLANLTRKIPGNPALGGQDYGHCCAEAVNQSLMIVDGNLAFRPGQTFLTGNMSTFLAFQYPCTAVYNGSNGDQPQVNVPYSFCYQNCGGWEKTKSSKTSDWVQPLIGYILPTVAFCYTIPRRRSIVIPHELFPANNLLAFPGNLTLFYKLPIAGLLMLLDTIQWLLACVVMSAPMLLAGLLEAQLDSSILRYLDETKILSPRKRAHLLLVILIGNLDEDPAWHHSKTFISMLDDNVGTAPQLLQTIPFHEIKPPTLKPFSQFRPGPNRTTKEDNTELRHRLTAQLYNKSAGRRLISLLESQASFGTSVGIGVLFFLSSFFYSIQSIKDDWGDGGTAHALAFGCFWLTIGHIAVVAGVLLAGNNPSAWEAATIESEEEQQRLPWQRNPSSSAENNIRRWSEIALRKRRFSLPLTFKNKWYRSISSSQYKTAWMWNRGNTKAMWIAELSEEYPELDLQNKILKLSVIDLIFKLTVPTALLFFIPAFLGGMVRQVIPYVTPTVGISCRSMVPLFYTSAQGLLLLLWLVDLQFWKRARDGSVWTMKTLRQMRMQRVTLIELVWYILFFLGTFWALVTSVGGTTFHLMGLFTNCLCWIPLADWGRRWSPDVTLSLGFDSNVQIWTARTYWLPIGLAASLFLAFTTYVGWQYQHRLRVKFIHLASSIGGDEKLASDGPFTSIASKDEDSEEATVSIQGTPSRSSGAVEKGERQDDPPTSLTQLGKSVPEST